jgi:NAD(P)-dependent dehydrogenase (short-subunit alcohol dehydrogenase family)
MTTIDHTRRQVVLIAGANRGSGPATALQLAGEGHHVVLGARPSGKVRALVDEIRKAGGSAEWFALDDSQPDQMREFLAFARDIHQRVDIVINNA